MSPGLAERQGIGDRVAASEVRLTATEKSSGQVLIELSPETLARINLGKLHGGDEVNLELISRCHTIRPGYG
jgi:riboflavin synthase alpha subunit